MSSKLKKISQKSSLREKTVALQWVSMFFTEYKLLDKYSNYVNAVKNKEEIPKWEN